MRLSGLPALLASFAVSCGGAGSGGPARSPTPPAVCGDGVVQPGEECDDADADDGDACLRTCETPASFVPSDPHIHAHGCDGDASSEDLQRTSSDRGVAVTVPMVWGDGYHLDRRSFTGFDHPSSRPGSIVHWEMEISQFAAARTGHLLLWGLRSIDFSGAPSRSPQSGMPVTDFARGQGPQVVVGMAHGQFWPPTGALPAFPDATCCMPFDFAPEALRGRVTLLGTEHRPGLPVLDAGTAFLHRAVLNAGGRAALVGASDFPCINVRMSADVPRTDVLLDEPGDVSYDRWLAALGRGRTVLAAGAGTRLDLRANGARIGDEVHLRSGQALRVTVESRQPSAAQVVVSVNGEATASAALDAGAQAAGFDLRLDRSAWLQAATPWAATSPIYVLVDDRPIRGSASDICYLVRYLDRLIRAVERRELDLGAETDGALLAYQEVRAELLRRFSEAGGVQCP